MHRIDPEMAAFNAMMEERAKAFPPIRLMRPFDEARAINDALNLTLGGGPEMAETREFWLPVRGRRIQCRLHKPVAGQGPLPVLVYLHGGGWVWNSIDTHDRTMREYAAASGCAVLGPDYALSPEAVFPQALEECAGIARAVAAQGGEWGLDPARMVLGGDSAGANLALGSALMLREVAPALRLRGLLLGYGVYDSRLDTESYEEFAEGFGLTRERMRFYWDCYAPQAADRVNPFAAPLRADLRGLPPVHMTLTELDVLASENFAMAAKLREAGVDVDEEFFAGTVHGFLRSAGHVGAADRAFAASGRWLRKVMG
ncbi:alpha/beta hydrolase [Roseomonas marmotae]|uniref:Alpha/beta hydrolase n=1 Tax=Roseomonas marmotae TaxID=2768161 RepID=A0ABS3KH77_9PROT|nr:alpha/beta hydrolase [Roseomonas marmotae]MBO1076822.1 alpha/beta hydrolase [Roseomonas marmotae]QTI78716.1 alpha/beta hydrolase [Roseomonas marmotae]